MIKIDGPSLKEWVTYLIKTTSDPDWGESGKPPGWYATSVDGANLYLMQDAKDRAGNSVLCDVLREIGLDPATATVVGAWKTDGTPVGEVNVEAFIELCPLGNYRAHQRINDNGEAVSVRAGHATDRLELPGMSGSAIRQLGDNGALYPAEISPIGLDIRRVDAGGGKHGWRAEVIGLHFRSLVSRSVGIYADEQCEAKINETVAFQFGESAWQPGADAWFVECPGASETDDIQPLYLALLHNSSIQEGFCSVAADTDSVRLFFWESVQ